MQLQLKNISETYMVSMSVAGNIKSCELLFDKYAPVMYGMICNLTSDKMMAEEILKAAFIDLKDNHVLLNEKVGFYPALMRYVHAFTKKQLTLHGINSQLNQSSEKKSLINLLCTDCSSLKEAAQLYNITEAETRKKLRLEFSQLRNQKINR